ncbi:energy-coupling factor transporter transmembrane component T [Verrucosispora sp. WMMD573]|uniref:energy-coupling factor transporter transmembrane component T family protein n=1 Tax=Verrucosispora sp. WMMD573 TaxID=3015149 RepID=UPI00248C16C3|nr:energy-coupling factor transporter transmembrane component T [Verrucosispora sp. WMMD573]WBB53635.1 energy-coupling factor transporter transmembrane component T [Verrucosispora sp. WMMD573]
MTVRAVRNSVVVLTEPDLNGSVWDLRTYNPLVKALGPIPAMVVAIGSRDLLTPALFAALTLALLLGGSRLAARTLGGLLIGVATLVAVMTVSFGIWTDPSRVDHTHALLRLGPLTLWSGALETGFATGLRVGAVVLLALLSGLTTHGADLVRSMIAQLRVPYRIGYAGLAALRFVPRFAQELDTIRNAHRVRGLSGGRGPVAGVRRYAGYAIPLLAGGIRHADRVSLSMESRGFGAYPSRTERRHIPFRLRDGALLTLLLACAPLVPLLAHHLTGGTP